MLRDDATGLLSRSGFLFLTEHLIKIAARGGHGLLLLSLGLRKGAASEGSVPAALTDLLVKSFRGSDVKARVAPDEFVVLAIDAPTGTARMLTERLRRTIDAYNRSVPGNQRLDVDIGMTAYESGASATPEDLLARGRAARQA